MLHSANVHRCCSNSSHVALLEYWLDNGMSRTRPEVYTYPLNVSSGLLPLALHREGGPVVWRVPTFGFPHGDLSGPECGRRSFVADKHCFVKRSHESRGGSVVDSP